MSSPTPKDEETCCDLWPLCWCILEEDDEAEEFERATCDEDGYSIDGHAVDEATYHRFHYDPPPRG